MGRPFNFAAGPSMLPESVLKSVSDAVIDYEGHGYSILEMMHRKPPFEAILLELKSRVKSLLAVPDDFEILFCPGGGKMQFAMVPLNFMTTGKADYIVSGNFSGLAAKEAAKATAEEILAAYNSGKSLESIAGNYEKATYYNTTDATYYDGVVGNWLFDDARKDGDTLVIGITEFEPMDYQDADGNWIGFDADMAKLVAEKLGVEPVFTVINWDNKVFELNGKGIDVVWNGMTITTAAQEAMECTNAYCNNAQVIVTK